MPVHGEADEVLSRHRRRWKEIDPWLPSASPLDEPLSQDIVLACADGKALGRTRDIDAHSFAASWSALHTHELIARIASRQGMETLLAGWDSHLAMLGISELKDTRAVVVWPSRDVEMTRIFLGHRMAPLTVLAARSPRRPVRPASPTVTVRLLTVADIGHATALWLEVIDWDAQFGSMTLRPSTEANIRKELMEAASEELPWAWLAVARDEPVGLIVVSPPDAARWVAPLASVSPAAYITCLGVDRRHRGAGIGTALVEAAHSALDHSGVELTLLHYAALNPLSGPFWHRCGYRPLWTTWVQLPFGQPYR
jgi:GNAT superfamily N-acetyltransferase